MNERRANVAELADEFVARATGRRSPGYSWKGQAVEAATAILHAVNDQPRPKLADAVSVGNTLPGDSRADLVDRLLEGLQGIEEKHGLKGSLAATANGYSLRFEPSSSAS